MTLRPCDTIRAMLRAASLAILLQLVLVLMTSLVEASSPSRARETYNNQIAFHEEGEASASHADGE